MNSLWWQNSVCNNTNNRCILQLHCIVSDELQGRLKTATENEKLTLGECTDLQRKVSQLEQQLSRAYHETEMLKVESDQSKAEKILLEQDLMRYTCKI